MKLLIDNNLSQHLWKNFQDHDPSSTAQSAVYNGWHRLNNSLLLSAARNAGFTHVISADKNIQLNRPAPSPAILTVEPNDPDIVRQNIPLILDHLKRLETNQYKSLKLPSRPQDREYRPGPKRPAKPRGP